MTGESFGGGSAARVLVLYWYPGGMRPAIRHHLRALDYARRAHRILYWNVANGSPSWLRHLDFDAVILHTTYLCLRWNHLFAMWKWKTRWVRELASVKIAMPQDEYDHAEILDEWLAELGVSVIVTNFDEDRWKLLYPTMSERATFRKHFTGYIDEVTAQWCAQRMVPMEARANDIVYRAMHLPYWFGRHGQLKHRIAVVVGERARTRWGLTCDVSTRLEDAIVGDRWFDFLMSGRVVIGCETGSSVLDRRGEVKAAIQKMLRDDPLLSFEEVSARLPTGWDDFELFAIGPRHFEAIMTRTCQVLVEGHYDGVLEAGRHYLPLKRDFSNLDEVLEKIRDVELVTRVADQAYRDIYVNGQYTYQRLADAVEAVLQGPLPRRRRGRQYHVGVLWKAAEAVGAGQALAGGAAWPLLKRGRPLVGLAGVPRRALATGLLAIRLAVVCQPLRRILMTYLGGADWTRSIELDRVLADLLRLGVLHRAQIGRLKADRPFRVTARHDGDTRQLTLRSECVDAMGRLPAPADDAEAERVKRALRTLDVREMVWDHSGVARHVPYPLTRSHWLSISLGEAGVYRFTALLALLHRAPEKMGAAVWSILEARPRGPSRLRTRLGRIRLLAGLAILVAKSLLCVPVLRRVALAYLGDTEVRHGVSPKRLVSDLLRLIVIRRSRGRATRDGRDFTVGLSYDAGRGTVTFRSARADPDTTGNEGEFGQPPIDKPGSVSRIIWDHSSVASAVPCEVGWGGPAWLNLGSAGHYEFSALGALAGRHAARVWAAVISSAPRWGS